MASSTLRRYLVATGFIVATIVAVHTLGILSHDAAVAVDQTTVFIANVFALVSCALTARKTTGIERIWRTLIATGLSCVVIGIAVMTWEYIFLPRGAEPSLLVTLLLFVFPVCCFFALAAILSEETIGPYRESLGNLDRNRIVLILDSLVIIVSVLTVVWVAGLGEIISTSSSNTVAFWIRIQFLLKDPLLAMMVAVMLSLRPIAYRFRPQLILLGLGVASIAISNSAYIYVISATNPVEAPPASRSLYAGFVLGAVLIALAAWAIAVPEEDSRPLNRPGWELAPIQIFLPYALMGMMMIVILGRYIAGKGPKPYTVEMYLVVTVVSLVIVRQLVALVDNRALLSRVFEIQHQLRYQARHDALTGLANRAFFYENLERIVDRCSDYECVATLYFIDLDGFKNVNDALGHEAGDRILRAAGERLRTCVRSGDTVARLGGDEFAVLIRSGTDSPEELGHRLITELRRPLEINGKTATVGASVGMTRINRDEKGLTADTLLCRADAAMYASKRRGKGLLVPYEPGVESSPTIDKPEQVVSKPNTPTSLSKLLTEGSIFDVCYQPIVRIRNGEIIAMEALARWTHPLLGHVPTSTFIAAAEESGLIGDFDNYVLDRACRDISEHPESYGTHKSVHVNISTSRLGLPALEQTVRSTLDRYQVSPRSLVLEITESRGDPISEEAVAGINRLRDMGIRLALDDFDAINGILSWPYLLPLDIVKIDCGGTSISDPQVEDSCRSVVHAANNLGMTIIAEGIETPQQSNRLMRAGCVYGQGFLYGKPEPLHTRSPVTGA